MKRHGTFIVVHRQPLEVTKDKRVVSVQLMIRCISQEWDPGHAGGNDALYHWTTDASAAMTLHATKPRAQR